MFLDESYWAHYSRGMGTRIGAELDVSVYPLGRRFPLRFAAGTYAANPTGPTNVPIGSETPQRNLRPIGIELACISSRIASGRMHFSPPKIRTRRFDLHDVDMEMTDQRYGRRQRRWIQQPQPNRHL